MNDEDITIEQVCEFLENFKIKKIARLKDDIFNFGSFSFDLRFDLSASKKYTKEELDKIHHDNWLYIKWTETEINTLIKYFGYVLATLWAEKEKAKYGWD